MPDFIRPEIQRALWWLREVVTGLALILLGIWVVLGLGGLMSFLGSGLIVAGGLLALIGVQRTRFRQSSGGLGMVDLDEGQVTYFGPLTGGAVALRDLEDVSLLRSRQTPHWRLRAGDTEVLIPTDASGADALFDAFATLPGLKMEKVLAELSAKGAHDTVIWSRTPTQPHGRRLH